MMLPSAVRPVLFIICFSSLLAGCAGTTRVPLNQEASARLSRVDSVVLIPADEIIVRAKPSSVSLALGGGLIPALIDASITSSRQTELEAIANPFYAGAENIEFRTLFNDSFKGMIQEQKLLPNLNVTVSTTGLSRTALESRRTSLKPGEAFLGLRIWYEFTPDTRSVLVSAGSVLVTADSKDPIFKNTYLYVSQPIEGPNPLTAWADNQGQALAAVFAESGKAIGRLLEQDLAGPNNETLFASLAEQEKVKFTMPTFMPITISGFVVEKTAERRIIRAASGELLSVPN